MSRRCMGCMEQFGDEFEICPHCGYIVGTPAEEAIHMEPGTILNNRYIVGRVLGFGGFGVTYIGWDGKLEQKVAIKEYLPGEFSTRMPGQSQITVFNGDKSKQFHDGLTKFVGEAKRLAKFQNEPGIVTIFDSFEQNDTAYIIMEYLDGQTLTEYLKTSGPVPEDVAVDMIMPIMDSLQVIHEEGILHRDIAPDNIFITNTGEIKLIDFGASRYATTSHSRSLTVIIKPGYSPEEQYRSRGDQGPYTDVYALAATLYKMITGKTPPDAMERRAKYENQNKDILVEPHKITKKISPIRENAILNAMNVRIEDRTPDIPTFIKELNAKTPAKRRYGKIKKIDVYSWPLWLKILIPALLTAVLTFGALLLTGKINLSKYTTVMDLPDTIVIAPDVEGMKLDEATQRIEEGGLRVQTGGSIESEYISAGTILTQDPVGGSFVERNGLVSLLVSSGKAVEEAVDGISTVPYVIAKTEEDARAALIQAGLGISDIEYVHDANIAEGLVISQSIEAGEEVPEGTLLDLAVSLGPESFEMPNVIGLTEEEARKALDELGLKVSSDYQNSDTVPQGEVFGQSVEAGTEMKPGDSVTITVSSGKDQKLVTVPNVVGKTRQEAEQILKDGKFKVKVVENYSDTVEKGKVISQSPKANTSQPEGSEVIITVSKGRQKVSVTGVSLDRTSVSLKTGETTTLVAKVSPDNADNKSVSWSSSNNNVAKVDSNGKVTAVNEGTATITVKTADGGKTAKCTVTVSQNKISVTGVSVTPTSVNMQVGDYKTLTATVTPSNATDKSVTWSSDKTYVATVNQSGKVTAVGPGTAVITVTTNDGGKTAKCTVTVPNPNVAVTGVTLDYHQLSMTVGATKTLHATVLPYNATNKSVTWSSNNNSVATVSSSGVVTARAAGQAIIKVTTVDGGHYDTCTINVTLPNVPVTGVTVTPTSLNLIVGNTTQLSATVIPSNATDKGIIWQSYNTNVVTVSDTGFVRAVGAGETDIFAKAHANPSINARCHVVVGDGVIHVTGITVSPHTLSLTVGDTSTLTATVRPDNATNKTVSWSTTDTSVATVNQNGKVTAIGAGTAIIKAKTVDGNYQDNCTVTVVEPEPEWVHVYYNVNGDGATVSPSSSYVKVGSTILNFPVPTWDYHNFQGWYTSASGGSQVTAPYTVPNHDVTLYAHWQLKSVSDWVPYDQMPAGAQIVQEKWTYTRTTTVETTSSSSPGSGYTLLRTYWRQINSGSFYYSREFIDGFDTGNAYYSYNRDPYTAYENPSSKREVSTGWAGYIYWHWMYEVEYANTTDRAISHRYGYWNADGSPGGGFLYKYFTAIASTIDCPYLDNYFCCSQNLPSYYCHIIITDTTHVGTPRMFRLNYYTCSYTDYEKVYVYQLTENLESSTPVYPSDSISNIVHWVKYRPI